MMRYVIVGAGEAGLRAAVALRDAGERHVVLIGGESEDPYERPALSKPSSSEGFRKGIDVDLAGIELRLGTTAVAISRSDQLTSLSDGSNLAYDCLLLATGAVPRRLPCNHIGAALPLRTLEDAQTIYRQTSEGGRAVIIGAGLIGLEMAAELRRRKMDVTVVEAGPRALGRSISDDIAQIVAQRHRSEGVRLLCGRGVDAISHHEVVLDDGLCLPADLIIEAVGVLPRTGLAEAAGLQCQNGVVVDAQLRTSDPAIFAAGDCASVDHAKYGRVRFETWRNAMDQGVFAANAMLGSAQKFDALPWFWSDHYELGIQAVGLHNPQLEFAVREVEGGFLRFELDTDGRLSAASGVAPSNSIAKDIRLAEKLISTGAVCDRNFLSDSSVNLKIALKAAQESSSFIE